MLRSRSAYALARLALGAMTALGALVASCSNNVMRGGFGQDCYPNGTCNEGLSCYSNLCLDPPTGGVGGGRGGGGGAAGSSAGGAGSAGLGGGGGGIAGGAGIGGIGIAGTTGAPGGQGGAVAGTSGGGAGAGGSGSGGIGGQAGAGGGGVDAGGSAGGCVVVDAGAAENFAVAACGYTPGTTTGSYSGIVTLTVSGVLVNEPGSSYQDGFYTLDPANTARALDACPHCFRYNRFSEAACVCSSECPNTSHMVADLLVGPYPAFEPSHVYTVQLNVSPGIPARLRFGMADCGCNDNSGSYAVTIQQNVCGS